MQHNRRLVITAFVLMLLAFAQAPGFAGSTNCPEHFAGGEAPDLIYTKLNLMAREVCYAGYAIMHSGVTRTPIYSAEYLTKERIQQAKKLKRQNRFHPDDNIPKSERAELSHYAKSGYDRGHMAPSADMLDEQSQYESFSLANIVPQNPNNNRGAWARLELSIRQLVKNSGAIYVITGAIFNSMNPIQIGNAVKVPSHFFKAIYNPATKSSEAYLVENSESEMDISISLNELEQLSGIDIFPGIENNRGDRSQAGQRSNLQR